MFQIESRSSKTIAESRNTALEFFTTNSEVALLGFTDGSFKNRSTGEMVETWKLCFAELDSERKVKRLVVTALSVFENGPLGILDADGKVHRHVGAVVDFVNRAVEQHLDMNRDSLYATHIVPQLALNVVAVKAKPIVCISRLGNRYNRAVYDVNGVKDANGQQVKFVLNDAAKGIITKLAKARGIRIIMENSIINPEAYKAPQQAAPETADANAGSDAASSDGLPF